MELLYNPDAMSAAEFNATFVGREDLLRELTDLLRSQPDGAGVQHAMVIAPRGMGKTSLLQRINHSVRDSDLATTWLALKYPEELYGVADLADFWLETLRLLAVETQQPDLAEQAQTLPGRFKQRGDVADAAYAVLKDVRQRSGQRLLLLVENLDQLFETLADEQDNARLRDVLMNDGTLMLLGSAVKFFKQARGYEQPLYNFFRVLELNPLSFAQTQDLLLHRAKEDGIAHFADTLKAHNARQRTLYHFTQGVPRLALMLYRVLLESDVSGVRQALEKLLDEVTPYYKHRIEVLPPQQRKLVEYIARAAAKTHEGVSPTDLAAAVNLPVNQVNAQLGKLLEAGYLRRAALPGRAACYVLSEPLYALWHQMRLNPETRSRKLGWLVDLLYQWYDDRERLEEMERLFQRYQEYERDNDAPHALAAVEHAHLLAQSAINTEVAGRVLRTTTGMTVLARNRNFAMDNNPASLAELRYNIEAALAKNPDDADSWATKGNYLDWIDHDYAAALDCYDRALAIKPDDAPVWGDRGTVLFFLARYKEALIAHERSLKIDPNEAVRWNNYAVTLGGLERYTEAMTACAKALALDPNLSLAKTNQAILFTTIEERFLRTIQVKQLKTARQLWAVLCQPAEESTLAPIRLRCLTFTARRGLWDFTRKLIATAQLGDELFPLDRALEYLQSGNEASLEKLSPEIQSVVRTLVEDLRRSQVGWASPTKKARGKL